MAVAFGVTASPGIWTRRFRQPLLLGLTLVALGLVLGLLAQYNSSSFDDAIQAESTLGRLAIWMAAVPTPDAPACTSAQPPEVSPPWVTRASWAVMNTSGMAAASRSSTPEGTHCSMRSWVTTCSAFAPPDTMPMTSSPTDQPMTRSPSAAMMPANSRPGISNSGLGPGAGYRPIRWSRSARFIAEQATSTSTSSGPGTGSGTSCTRRTSTPPYSGITTARMGGDGTWEVVTLRARASRCRSCAGRREELP